MRSLRSAKQLGIFLLTLALATFVLVGCGGGSSAPADATKVDVKLTEFHIEPPEIRVPAGAVSFAIVNDGTQAHNLVIPELNADSNMLTPGDSTTMNFKATAGTYEMHCNVAGHMESGMVGTIIVE